MKEKFKNLILSPLLIFFGICFIIIFLIFINYTFIDNKGGNALGGVIALIGLLLIFFLVIIEQFILKIGNFNKKYVWIFELIVIILIIIYFSLYGFSIG